MPFDVVIDHLLGDVACAPCPVANGPEVSPPIALPEVREFILEKAGCSSLETLHDVGDGELGRVLDVHVDMIGAHGSFEDADVL